MQCWDSVRLAAAIGSENGLLLMPVWDISLCDLCEFYFKTFGYLPAIYWIGITLVHPYSVLDIISIKDC